MRGEDEYQAGKYGEDASNSGHDFLLTQPSSSKLSQPFANHSFESGTVLLHLVAGADGHEAAVLGDPFHQAGRVGKMHRLRLFRLCAGMEDKLDRLVGAQIDGGEIVGGAKAR